ncbi:hypothetical protein Fmac_012052 [Flemingia macrophylla]|uniref:Uncharacterized protein n=1 Tax=Flemingia macrophylla TaxID=520843 RepID=A0ABD1MPM2_9FABA
MDEGLMIQKESLLKTTIGRIAQITVNEIFLLSHIINVLAKLIDGWSRRKF